MSFGNYVRFIFGLGIWLFVYIYMSMVYLVDIVYCFCNEGIDVVDKMRGKFVDIFFIILVFLKD